MWMNLMYSIKVSSKDRVFGLLIQQRQNVITAHTKAVSSPPLHVGIRFTGNIDFPTAQFRAHLRPEVCANVVTVK